VSLGEAVDESGAVSLSIGLSPVSERKEAWAYPNGSLFLHNNGRAVHYNGPSLIHWRSIRLDRSLNPGDRITVTLADGRYRLFSSINTIRQIVAYDTIFTDRSNPIFVVRHFQISRDAIFTNIYRII
jgi:hypothetical protein